MLWVAVVALLCARTAALGVAFDGLPEQPCRNPAICFNHTRAQFERDWADVVNSVGPFLPHRRSRCFLAPVQPGSLANPELHCLPGFMIGGFPKCSSTTMYNKFGMHPLVSKPRVKEPHWFSKSANLQSFPVYLQLWRSAQHIYFNNTLAYEASASTIWYRGYRNPRLRNMLLPEALHYLLPDLKMLILVRDPTERAWSEYKFMHTLLPVPNASAGGFHDGVVQSLALWKRCRETKPVSVCVYDVGLSELLPRLPISMYAVFIEHFLRFFPAHQFMVVSLEWFAAEPRKVMEAVFRFAGLPVPGEPLMTNIIAAKALNENVGMKSLVPHEKTMALLRDFYRPFNTRFKQLMHSLNQTFAF